MKLFFSACAALLLSVTAFAENGSELFDVQKSAKMDLTTLPGIWRAQDQQDNGVSFGFRAKFSGSEVQVVVKCEASGKVGFATLTVPVAVSATTVEILESKTVQTVTNGVTCTAEATKMAPTAYEVRLGYMYIGGVQMFEKLSDL